MGILDSIDLNNVPDLELLADGEYEVKILKAEEHTSQGSGKTSLRLILQVLGESDAENIFHYVALPADSDDEKLKNDKLRMLKDTVTAFAIERYTELESWVGQTAWANITKQEYEGRESNRVKSFVLPK